MRTRRALIVITCGVAPMAGCMMHQFQQLRYVQSLVEPRASFEMDCAPDKLKFTDLSSENSLLIDTVGVQGCGKRLVYVRGPNGQYFVNSTSDERAREP